MKKSSGLNWIYNSLGRHKSTLFLLTFLSALNSAITTLSTLITLGLVDAAVYSNQSSSNIYSYILYYGVFIFLTLVIQILEVYISNKLNIQLDISYRKRILGDVLKKDYRKVQSFHSGDILTRATTDVAVVTQGCTHILPNFIGILVRIITSLVVMFIIDWQLALVLIVIAPITLIASRYYGKKIKTYHKRAQKIESENRSFMTEAIQNVTVIKAFRNDLPIQNYYDDIQKKGYKIKMKINVFSIIANVLMFLSISLLYYFALIWGAYRVAIGLLTAGQLTAILQLVVQFQSPFKTLSGIINSFYRMRASAERIQEFTSIPDETTFSNGYDDYEEFEKIEISNLSFSYDEIPVIQNLSTTIEKGEFIGISGHSGSGKSTLLKLIIGLLTPNSGDVQLVGLKGKMDSRALFSYVPQGNMILSGTIRENVSFFNNNISDEVIYNALKLCCLDDVVKSLPNGIDSSIGEFGLGLSEGQLQRLSIARALVMGKKILLLDEATSALDEETEREVIKNLKSNNYTIILVTHHSKLLLECDRVIKF